MCVCVSEEEEGYRAILSQISRHINKPRWVHLTIIVCMCMLAWRNNGPGGGGELGNRNNTQKDLSLSQVETFFEKRSQV